MCYWRGTEDTAETLAVLGERHGLDGAHMTRAEAEEIMNNVLASDEERIAAGKFYRAQLQFEFLTQTEDLADILTVVRDGYDSLGDVDEQRGYAQMILSKLDEMPIADYVKHWPELDWADDERRILAIHDNVRAFMGGK